MSNINEFKFVSNTRGMLPKEGEPYYCSAGEKLKIWILEDEASVGKEICQIIVEYDGIDFTQSGIGGTVPYGSKHSVARQAWGLISDVVGYVAITSQNSAEREAFNELIVGVVMDLAAKTTWVSPRFQHWAIEQIRRQPAPPADDFFYCGVLPAFRDNVIYVCKFSDGELTYTARTLHLGGGRLEFEINFDDESRGLEIRNHFAVPFGEDWRPGLEKMLNDHKSVLSQISRYR